MLLVAFVRLSRGLSFPTLIQSTLIVLPDIKLCLTITIHSIAQVLFVVVVDPHRM